MVQSGKYTIAFILGTRPELIKLAPVIREIEQHRESCQALVISTGQHQQMLEPLYGLFGIRPFIDLKIMRPNQSLHHIAATALVELSEVFATREVDLVLVQGDTSTAFAAALAAYYKKIPVGHVEAGLRTGARYSPFPEEMNRRLIAPLADLHFTPTELNRANLLGEGVAPEATFLTGNTVIDALLYTAGRAAAASDPLLAGILAHPSRKILVTCHRRESFGMPLRNIAAAIAELVAGYPDVEIIYPLHLNPNVRQVMLEELGKCERVHLIEPLDYENFAAVLKASYLVLTDSGGVQEEAPSLGKPVLVMRENTERPEGVAAGTAKLVGSNTGTIVREAARLLDDQLAYARMAKAINPYGDGRAARRICDVILYHAGLRATLPPEFGAQEHLRVADEYRYRVSGGISAG